MYYDLEYDASNTYGVRSIPETIFIHADGSLYDTRVGAMSENVLEKYIKQLIGGEGPHQDAQKFMTIGFPK